MRAASHTAWTSSSVSEGGNEAAASAPAFAAAAAAFALLLLLAFALRAVPETAATAKRRAERAEAPRVVSSPVAASARERAARRSGTEAAARDEAIFLGASGWIRG